MASCQSLNGDLHSVKRGSGADDPTKDTTRTEETSAIDPASERRDRIRLRSHPDCYIITVTRTKIWRRGWRGSGHLLWAFPSFRLEAFQPPFGVGFAKIASTLIPEARFGGIARHAGYGAPAEKNRIEGRSQY